MFYISGKNYKYGIPSQNDYHHKNRIEILCKKTCFAAPPSFFSS